MRALLLYFGRNTHTSLVSAIAWGFVYSFGLVGTIRLAILMVLRDYLLTGIIVATIIWCVACLSITPALLPSAQVHRKPPSPLSSLTLHTSRRTRRMGLRVRRTHERVLPSLPRTLPCPALLTTHRAPG